MAWKSRRPKTYRGGTFAKTIGRADPAPSCKRCAKTGVGGVVLPGSDDSLLPMVVPILNILFSLLLIAHAFVTAWRRRLTNVTL